MFLFPYKEENISIYITLIMHFFDVFPPPNTS